MGLSAGSLTYSTQLDVNGFEKGLKNVEAKSVAIGNIISKSFEKVVNVATDLTKTGINYNAQIEKYKTALTTLTGSAEKANSIIDQIKKDAAKTPFDVSGLTQANQLLISAGVSSDSAREDVLALGNAISATGGGNEELSRMAVNLQQIKNVGKASALDIKQFAYAGIDVYGLLADYMGVARDEATEMDITYEDLTGALKYASEEGGKYFGAMENQSKTFNGQMETLKDNFNSFLGEATKPLFDYLTETAIPKLNEMLEAFSTLGEFLENHKTAFTLLAIAIGTLTTAIIANTIAKNLDLIVIWLYVTATTVATTVTTAFAAVLAFITSPITLVVLAIGALIAIVYLLIKNWDTVSEVTRKVWQSIKTFVSNGISVVGNLIKQLASTIINVLGSAISGIYNIGKNIVQGIWNGISGAAGWLANKVKSFATGILNNIKSALGIHSPSTVMRDMVGKFIPEGIAIGISANTDSVYKALDKLDDEMVDKMSNAVNMETGKMSFSGTNASVNQILNANGTFTGNMTNILTLDGEKIYENQKVISARKALQYGGAY